VVWEKTTAEVISKPRLRREAQLGDDLVCASPVLGPLALALEAWSKLMPSGGVTNSGWPLGGRSSTKCAIPSCDDHA